MKVKVKCSCGSEFEGEAKGRRGTRSLDDRLARWETHHSKCGDHWDTDRGAVIKHEILQIREVGRVAIWSEIEAIKAALSVASGVSKVEDGGPTYLAKESLKLQKKNANEKLREWNARTQVLMEDGPEE